MAAWAIFDYVSASGANEIRSWIDSLPLAAQVRIDTRLRYLAITAVWDAQYVSSRKDCAGIYEIRVVSSGVQYRPLGYYGPGRREFTLLLGAIEKGGRLQPKGFCETATNRRNIINGDRNRIVPHRYG